MAASLLSSASPSTREADAAKLALSAEHKAAGNAAFASGRQSEAITAFSSAIALDPANAVLYSNRAAAYTALGKKEPVLLAKAVADARLALRLQPEFVKAYARLGTALSLQRHYEEAVQCFAAGLSKDPSSRLLLEGLQQAQKFVTEKRGGAAADADDADTAAAAASALSSADASSGAAVQDVVIGIDLGTTYSCVGVWQGAGVTMIPNERGSLTSPSWVCFDSGSGKRFVGQAAKNQAARFPSNSIFDVKRIIGQKYEDEGVSADIDRMPYRVLPSEPATSAGGKGRGKPMIQVDLGMHGKKSFAPEEISAMVLAYLKRTAEVFLKRPVSKAVITVPAYFNDSQRSATKAAGRIAGLDVLRIINEPTAAALSYGLDRRHQERPAKVLIFDLGGGTFDVSVLNIEGGVTEVKATGGDTRLGGEDFDITVTRFLVQESIAQGLPDISGDARAMRRLQNAVEQAKRQLSQSSEADLHVEALFTLDVKQRGSATYKTADLNYKLSRARFEQLNMAFFNNLETVKKVLKDARLRPAEIDDVVLVGGSTRIPKMQEMLQEYFGGKELCRSLNPDEAVAYGAAVQGAILNNSRDAATANLLLMDVTPLSLGIETTGRVMSVIIPRNTSIPCVKTQSYTTEENYQTEIDVCVYEGERSRTDENNLLGKFTISGIERAKRGVPKIDVSFALDSNGILQVTARDQTTMAEARIEIERSGRSSDADIERMVREAARYRLEDEERVKRVEAFNELEALQAEGRQIVNDMTDAKKAAQLEQALDDTERWAKDNEETAKVAEIKLKRRQLETTLSKMQPK